MSWVAEYCKAAEQTDRLIGKPNHALLLAAGLFGEAGSILTELKKEIRETEAYPAYRNRLVEEIGDFLWYLTRLSTVLDPATLRGSDKRAQAQPQETRDKLTDAVTLGIVTGQLLRALQTATGIVSKSGLSQSGTPYSWWRKGPASTPTRPLKRISGRRRVDGPSSAFPRLSSTSISRTRNSFHENSISSFAKFGGTAK